LEPSAKFDVEGVSLGLYHGSPRDPLSEYVYPGISAASAQGIVQEGGARVVLLGHTHVPMIYFLEGEMLGNPGSVGQPRDGDPRASFAVLSVESSEKFSIEIKRVEYNIEKTANAIIKEGLPRFLSERLYTGM
jgi:diadenosine tetraphosphatase ApaH/serine/threonine PP2A family protein phosphatase